MSLFRCTTQISKPKPKNSLFVEIHPWVGMNQMRRSNGKFGWSYLSDIANSSVEIALDSGDSYIGGSTNVLTIYTDRPLILKYVRESDVQQQVEIHVRHLAVIDEVTAGFTITNPPTTSPSEDNQMARVWMNFATSNLGTAIAGVQSVNGQGPDASGNVGVDTGVMTVSGQSPDSQGNILAVTSINQTAPDPDGNATVSTDEGTFSI